MIDYTSKVAARTTSVFLFGVFTCPLPERGMSMRRVDVRPREIDCTVTEHPGLTALAQEVAISPIWGFPPALSHHRPEETFRLRRLQSVHRVMDKLLAKTGYYPWVIGLHDRKGVLIVVIDDMAPQIHADTCLQAACVAWASLNECEVAVARREVGRRRPANARIRGGGINVAGEWYVVEPEYQ